MIDIQVTKQKEYYDHIALLYLETRRCRYQFYLNVPVVISVDYPYMNKMIDNDKC